MWGNGNLNTELQCHQIPQLTGQCHSLQAINKPVYEHFTSYISKFTDWTESDKRSEFALIFLPASLWRLRRKEYQWCTAKFLSWVYSLYSPTLNWLQPVETMMEGVAGSAYSYLLHHLIHLEVVGDVLRIVSWAGIYNIIRKLACI